MNSFSRPVGAFAHRQFIVSFVETARGVPSATCGKAVHMRPHPRKCVHREFLLKTSHLITSTARHACALVDWITWLLVNIFNVCVPHGRTAICHYSTSLSLAPGSCSPSRGSPVGHVQTFALARHALADVPIHIQTCCLVTSTASFVCAPGRTDNLEQC